MRNLLRVGFLTLAVASVGLANFHDRFLIYFPQVAKGALGRHIETIIVIANPGNEPAEVFLTSGDSKRLPLTARATIQLQPGQTQRVEINGGEFRVGWVRLESTRLISAAAHILTRPSSDSAQILSQVTIPGQRPVSKVVVPVFRSTPSVAEIADNTGIAIVAIQPGSVVLTLRDIAGKMIASTSRRFSVSGGFSGEVLVHVAQFLTELFPEIPSDFSAGSLTIEYASFEIPMAFAATALYTRRDEIWSAAVTPIDVPGQFFVKFKSAENFQQQVAQLAAQYGFTVVGFFSGDPRLILARMVEEVARAVARDPRIEFVEQNAVGEAVSFPSESERSRR